MDVVSYLIGYVELLWPVLLIGVVVFAAWGAGKEAAKRSGRHLGVAGVGLVLVVLAVLSGWLGFVPIAWLLGIVGAILVVAGLSGKGG